MFVFVSCATSLTLLWRNPRRGGVAFRYTMSALMLGFVCAYIASMFLTGGFELVPAALGGVLLALLVAMFRAIWRRKSGRLGDG